MSDKNRIWDDREYFAILGIDEDRALEITSKDIRSVYNTAIEGKDKGVNKHDREGFVAKANKALDILLDLVLRGIYISGGGESLEKFQEGKIDGESYTVAALKDCPVVHKGKEVPSLDCEAESIDVYISFSLEELCRPRFYDITLKVHRVCPVCSGAEESVRIYAKESNFCYGCSAKTTITEDCRIGDKTVSSRSECFTCSGTGLSMPAENCCKRCSGRLVVDGDEKIKTFIPMGAYDGYRHIITKKGNEFPGKQRGCVIVNVMEEKHGIFKRRESDLFMDLDISLGEALCGFKRTITTIYGVKLTVSSPLGKVTRPDSIKTILGHGMPVCNLYVTGNTRGNLHIRFVVAMGRPLNEELRLNLLGALPESTVMDGRILKIKAVGPEIIDISDSD